ncbi:MAG TPA: hypothetical protein VMG12_41110 [Polyangiaceae bacterium]|nr:hypothetical protein [Polyangiaceae bacterium]
MKAARAIYGIAAAAVIGGIATQAAASVTMTISATQFGALPGGQRLELREFSDQGLTVRAANYLADDFRILRVAFIAGLDRATLSGLDAAGQTLPNCTNINTEPDTINVTECEGGRPVSYTLTIN